MVVRCDADDGGGEMEFFLEYDDKSAQSLMNRQNREWGDERDTNLWANLSVRTKPLFVATLNDEFDKKQNWFLWNKC